MNEAEKGNAVASQRMHMGRLPGTNLRYCRTFRCLHESGGLLASRPFYASERDTGAERYHKFIPVKEKVLQTVLHKGQSFNRLENNEMRSVL